MNFKSVVRSGKYVLEKKTKTQVRKIINEKGVFKGFICGNKVNPFHLADGWGLGAHIVFENVDEFNEYVERFETGLNVYTPELGTYPHYYQIIEENEESRV